MYLDYNFTQKRSRKVLNANNFQPLCTGINSKKQAKKVAKKLHLLETELSLSSIEDCGEIKNYQWGRAYLWPPIQLMAK